LRAWWPAGHWQEGPVPRGGDARRLLTFFGRGQSHFAARKSGQSPNCFSRPLGRGLGFVGLRPAVGHGEDAVDRV